MKYIPGFILEFICVFFKGGHKYGRWWWQLRNDAAHRLCDECAAEQNKKNLNSCRFRERG